MILVRLSPLQRALYTKFMKRFQEASSTGWLSLNPLKAFCVCCKVSRLRSLEKYCIRLCTFHLVSFCGVTDFTNGISS